MECNKDEAARAKELAEKKLAEKDIAGAKQFALEAQNLFPGLDGLSEFVEIIDVYLAYERKVCGEVDWYGVLGVEPSADDEMIKRQYRKLVLALHPDKNKVVGADGAYKILSEAWSLLSDQVKRVAYDQRRNIRFSYKKATGRMPSMPTGMKGFPNFSSNPLSVRNPKTAADHCPMPNPVPPKADSFWTSCSTCKIYFEYLKKYLNQCLHCHNCHQPFLAIEVTPPPVKGQQSSNPWFSHQQEQGVNNVTTDVSKASRRKFPAMGSPSFAHISSTSALKLQPFSFSEPVGARSDLGRTTSATQATSNLQQASRYLKSSDDSAKDGVIEVAAQNKSDRLTKMQQQDVKNSTAFRKETATKMALESRGLRQGNSSQYRGSLRGERTADPGKKHRKEESSQSEFCSMLMEKAKKDILKKLNEWREAAFSKSPANENKGKKTAIDTAGISSADGMRKADERNSMVKNTTFEHFPNSLVYAAQLNSDAKSSEFVTMAVPDSDFHDFDMDRVEGSFAENQVWAVYDDDDGMPRFYALVHGIISKRPFKVRVSRLRSKTNTELGPLDWIDSGFAKTCGEFRVGKQEINETLNSFSHMVKWTKGARGVIQIFPRKGEIWALYKNWSADWNELTPEEVVHKYDMVEVLEDYNEQQGVTVVPLMKVARFKSIFCQHTDLSKTWTIARQELFRFSHQVPSYSLTGQESENAPKGCRELDPAALPLELLQLIQEDKLVETVEKAKISANMERSEGERITEGEADAVADASATEERRTGDDTNVRCREPILTYSRKRKRNQVAGDMNEAKGEADFTGTKQPLSQSQGFDLSIA